MSKFLKFLIIFIILTILEVSTSTNSIAFSIIKTFGIILIVGAVKTTFKQYEKVIPLTIVLLLIPSVGAVDNTLSIPTCINPSYDSGKTFILTENPATIGNVSVSELTAGYFSPATTRIYNGSSLLCAISDPTTDGLISGQKRIFGSDESGNIWYTDGASVAYDLGFYSLLNPTYLYKIDTLGAATHFEGIKMTLDSQGNLYTYENTGKFIKRYTKSLDYTPTTIYTVTAADTLSTTLDSIQDVRIDSLDRLHFAAIGHTGATFYLTKTVITTNGGFLSRSSALINAAGGSGSASILLDSTNPEQNFTYAYNIGTATYLKHNSTAGTVDIAGGSMGAYSIVGGVAYRNFQIYVPFPLGNLTKTYATNFEGYIPTAPSTTTPAQLTYDVSTISSEQTTYGNNSVINLNTHIQFTTSILDKSINNDYRWKTEINDPSGLLIVSHFSGKCTYPSVLSTVCSINETLQILPPALNWTNGTYTAYLKEYNVNTYSLATLDSTTYNVLNTSQNNTGISITVPITSGSGITTLDQWDSYVEMMGMGVNSISKLFFALIIITVIALLGIKIAGGDAAMVGAFAPYIFFTYIEYIPKWIFIILIIMLVQKSKIFR